MITIQITRATNRTWEEQQNLVVTRTPTAIIGKKDRYSEEANLFEETFAPGTVTQTKIEKVELLNQNIENDEKFDLGAVLKAINNL